MLFPPEAPCERMGSFMRLLWDPTRRLDPKSMEDLVLLEQAGSGVPLQPDLAEPTHPVQHGVSRLST